MVNWTFSITYGVHFDESREETLIWRVIYTYMTCRNMCLREMYKKIYFFVSFKFFVLFCAIHFCALLLDLLIFGILNSISHLSNLYLSSCWDHRFTRTTNFSTNYRSFLWPLNIIYDYVYTLQHTEIYIYNDKNTKKTL